MQVRAQFTSSQSSPCTCQWNFYIFFIKYSQPPSDVDEDNFDNDIVTEDEDEVAKEHIATTQGM